MSDELQETLAFLAVELFGWEYKDWTGFGEAWNQPLDSLLNGAWMLNIIEAMRERGHTCWMWYMAAHYDPGKAHCKFETIDGMKDHERIADRFPEAVARAAYAALRATR